MKKKTDVKNPPKTKVKIVMPKPVKVKPKKIGAVWF